MAAHAGWNFCQNILLGLPNSGSVVVEVIALSLIVWWGIKHKTVPTNIWDAEA